MGSEWNEVTASEFCDSVRDGTHDSPKQVESGKLLVTSRHITGNRLDLNSAYRISNEDYDDINKRSKVDQWDVLITMIGTVGEPCLIRSEPEFAIKNVGLFKNKSETHGKFLYYYLCSLEAQHHIKSHSRGTTQQYIPLGELRNFPVRYPAKVSEMLAIVHILGSLDDKIELNRRMNATLEGLAQALFKSWFVDFDPVLDNALAVGNPIPEELADRAELRRQALANGTANREAAKKFPAALQLTEEMGWIPEGWEVKKLSNLLEVKYGKDHKKLSDGSIPVYGSGGLMRHADKSLYKGESVLIPRKGTLSNILYLNEEFWTVDTMFYTIPKSKFVPKYAFYHLKSLDLASMNVGSAVPSMTTKVLNELPILMPVEPILQNFDSILTSYFDRTEANDKQSRSLAKLRDTLLPKLISGELRIPEAEKLTEEALA